MQKESRRLMYDSCKTDVRGTAVARMITAKLFYGALDVVPDSGESDFGKSEPDKDENAGLSGSMSIAIDDD